ncbi:hypothetical protein FS837_004794, partial [Tulasnella sp. UAMH 9824]
MCHGCDPGVTALARILTSGLNLSKDVGNLIQPDVVESENDPVEGESSIFYNGSIITMAGGTFSPVEALAIKGASITAAGRLQDVRSLAGDTATMVDLNGQCILPGFVEPHLHLFLSALTIDYLVPLQPWKIPKRSDALKILQKEVDKVVNDPNKRDPKWVAAYGYDPSLVECQEELDACVLDGVSTAVGIFVLNQSGHIAYVNHRAFEIAGVKDDNTTRGLVKHDGKLTGKLLETQAIQLVAGHIQPKPNEETVKRHCAEKLGEWSAKGCTTVFDAGIGTVNLFDDVIMLAKVTDNPEHPLPLRFVAALMENMTDFPLPDMTTIGDQTPPLRIGNAKAQAKFWADGSTQGFTAALNEHYYRKPEEDRGKLLYDTEDIQGRMSKWMKKGWQLSIHANGDRAVDQSLECYEATFHQLPDRKKDIMHRIEHFTVSNTAQVEKAASLGLGVSHTIGHVYYWGETFQTFVLGPERAARIDPIKDDVDKELVYSFHSDSLLTEPDPLLFVRTAVTRLKYDSKEVLGQEQRVTLEDALRGVTVNPARQLNLEHRIGTLEKGKSADLVILAQDPRTIDPANLDTIAIRQTWYKGKK